MTLARRSFAARTRYRFDSALSGGPLVIALWLGVVTLAVGFLAALLVYILGLGYNGQERTGVLEGLWQSLLRLLDSGTFANDNGWGLRVIALSVTLVGIFLASSLIGLVATALDHKIGELRKGRSQVLETGHTLMLGWSPRLFTIVGEIVVANENQRDPVIVVLANEDKTFMEDELHARVADMKNTRLVCRTGDPSAPDNLALVNVASARSIVVLGVETPEGDAEVVRSVLAVLGADLRDPDVPIVAEMRNPRYASSLRKTSGGRVLTVQADEVIAQVAAQACNQVGLSHVYRELLDFDGDELYFASVPELHGHTFGDALLAFESSSVIGLIRPSGAVDVCPAMDAVVNDGDRVIAITEDDDTIVFTGFVDADPPDVADGDTTTRPLERILVVGWSLLGPGLLRDLDPFLDAGTEVDILYDDDLFDDDPLEGVEMHNAVLRVHRTDNEAAEVAGFGPARPYDQVIVLGYREGVSAAEADARTLLTLLAVRHTWPPEGDVRPRVVAEVLDSRNVTIARATGIDDFVVSDELSSLMISQLSERPELRLVFDELFDAAGASIAVHPAPWYVTGWRVPFSSVVAAAHAKDQIAIGYRLRDGTVVVNPDKSAVAALSRHDDVIVIGHFH